MGVSCHKFVNIISSIRTEFAPGAHTNFVTHIYVYTHMQEHYILPVLLLIYVFSDMPPYPMNVIIVYNLFVLLFGYIESLLRT